jgi:hypothetical protein
MIDDLNNRINKSIILYENSDLNNCILYDTAILYYRCMGETKIKNTPFNPGINMGFGLTVMYCAGSYNIQILIDQAGNIYSRILAANKWLEWKKLYNYNS